MTLAARQVQISVQAERAAMLKVGTPVIVIRDNGQAERTTVEREPWQLGHGDWVVKVKGIAGGYSVMRVFPERSEA